MANGYDYIYPSPVHRVSDNFQDHKARGSVNPGTDFVDPIGDPVWAVSDGVIQVTSGGIGGSGGRYIQYLDHYGNIHQDLHLSQIICVVGQRVTQGQQIARTGASAYGSETGTGGPHLHHSLIIHGNNADFQLYVNDVPAQGGANSTPITDTGDDDVLTPEQAQWLKEIHDRSASTDENAAEARRLAAQAVDQATLANENAAEARRLAGIQTGGLPPTATETPH